MVLWGQLHGRVGRCRHYSGNWLGGAGCHQEIARTFRLTGMGRSFTRLTPNQLRIAEPVRLHHEASQRYYTITQRDGILYQRRHQLELDGRETNVVELTADFVVGSGNHARTFLHRYPDGRLVQLPVSWYAENGGTWAMSPGYDRPAHMDFRRTMNEDCVSCHDAYPRTALEDEGNGSRFAEPVPEGIDCQRCHGPGRPSRRRRQKETSISLAAPLPIRRSSPASGSSRRACNAISSRPAARCRFGFGGTIDRRSRTCRARRCRTRSSTSTIRAA